MISIKYSAHDDYGRYGVEHFIEKYGLPMEYEAGRLRYELEGVESSFTIEVSNGKIQNSICGLLDSKIPVFEFPRKISSAKSIASFKNDGAEYTSVGYSDRKVEVGFDVFSEVGHLLSGHTEHLRGTAEYRMLSRFPIADYYEKVLFDSMLFAGKKLGIPIVRKSLWPRGKKFALCLTHDVDEVKKKYQYATRSIRYIKEANPRGVWNQLVSFTSKLSGAEPYWDCIDTMVSIEKKRNVRSTLFFLNEKAKVELLKPSSWRHYGRKFNIKAPFIVQKMRELEKGGWEVGVHGSYYSYNDGEMLRKEKSELDRLVGKKTTGTRQHCLNLKIPDTFIFQDRAGFEYDSTLGCNEYPCFRWGTCFPFHILEKNKMKKLSMLEIPLIIEDTALHRGRVDAWKESERLINIAKSYEGVITLLWHHAVFDRRESPGWAEEYNDILKSCKRNDAWIANGRDICRWWSERSSLMPSFSVDGDKLEITPNSRNTCYIDIFSPKDSRREVIRAKGKMRVGM
jgi:peptidoglycan/xylan/chitin deacetylase (PgdA/CDA1 family)